MSHVRAFAVTAGLLAVSVSARADVKHVVARGHTIDAISKRYHVAPKTIMDANRITDPRHLKVGDVLTIPGVSPPPGTPQPAVATKKPDPKAHPQAKPVTYVAAPKDPGLLHLHRLATNEDFSVRVNDRRGRLPPTALKSMETVLRYPNGVTHPIDARLIALLGIVSDHFGGRKIEVISGFRPYSPTQYTAHSNHNIGHAIDFRVMGVPNEVVRDFCRTLRNVGVGYYPNSVFVHLDSRATSAFWIDYSKPGEPPRYNAANLDPDEGASDVGAEAHLSGVVPEPRTESGSSVTPDVSESNKASP